ELRREAEQIQATEEELKRIAERHERLGDAFGEFTDGLTAWDEVVKANREWAENVAATTKDAEDSWEDYYDGFSVSTEEWIAEMQRQVDDQRDWHKNSVDIAAMGRADVAEILAGMGPEGAEIAQRFTELTGAEFQTAADLFVQTMSDAGQDIGRDL